MQQLPRQGHLDEFSVLATLKESPRYSDGDSTQVDLCADFSGWVILKRFDRSFWFNLRRPAFELFDVCGRFSERFQRCLALGENLAVLEYKEGKSLDKFISEGALHVNQIQYFHAWGLSGFDLLEELDGGDDHEQVLHRDLHPENLIVGPDDKLYAIDVDLACLASDKRKVREFCGPSFFNDPALLSRNGATAKRDLTVFVRSIVNLFSPTEKRPFRHKELLAEAYCKSHYSKKNSGAWLNGTPALQKLDALSCDDSLEEVHSLIRFWRSVYFDCMKHPDCRPDLVELRQRIDELS